MPLLEVENSEMNEDGVLFIVWRKMEWLVALAGKPWGCVFAEVSQTGTTTYIFVMPQCQIQGYLTPEGLDCVIK